MNFEIRRRMLMNGKTVFTIAYDINGSNYQYLQINGEGEKYDHSGSIEVEKGDFVRCFAYRNNTIYLNDVVVATGNVITNTVYDFYPESNATISKRGTSNNMYIVTE